MNETILPPTVSADESLARFITTGIWVRQDKSIRPDAFAPPNDLNLSVTRHIGISEQILWQIGQNVADAISKKRRSRLHGRADITAGEVTRQNLKVEAAPLTENANHAHITGWLDKPARKHIAQCLAAAAKFVARPQTLEASAGR